MLNLGNTLLNLVSPPAAPAPAPAAPPVLAEPVLPDPVAAVPPPTPTPDPAPQAPAAAAPAATPASPRPTVSMLPAETVVAAANLPEPPLDELAEARRLALAAQARFKLEDLVSRLATPPQAATVLRETAPAESRVRTVQPPGSLDKLT